MLLKCHLLFNLPSQRLSLRRGIRQPVGIHVHELIPHETSLGFTWDCRRDCVSDIFIYLKKKELFHKTGTTYSVVLKM